MNRIKNTLFLIFFLLVGLAANAQTETNSPENVDPIISVIDHEVKKEQKNVKSDNTISPEVKEVESVAFYFNHKLLMKQVIHKTVLC